MNNPYDVTTTDSHYVGNERLLGDLISRITTSTQSFAIVGGRRCGKTSTLYRLQKDLDKIPNHEVVYLTLYLSPGSFDHASATTRYSSADLWRRIYGLLTKEVSIAGQDPVAEVATYQSFLSVLRDTDDSLRSHHSGRQWIAIVMIDEIDAIKDGLPGDTLFFANLRELLSTSAYKSQFRFVVSGVNDLSGLTDAGSPLKNVLATKELGIIDDKSVEELIGLGFGEGLSDDSTRCLKELTGGHPYLLQGVLHELWHERNTTGATLDRSHVLAAARGFESDYGETFRVWREAIGDGACDVFGFLSACDGPASRKHLGDALGYSGGAIDDALARLATHGVVEAGIESKPVRITGSMFRDWFERHVAQPTVVDSLEYVYRAVDQIEDIEDDGGQKEAIKRVLSEALAAMEEEVPRKTVAAESIRKVCSSIRELGGTAEGMEKIVTTIAKAVPYLALGAKALGL